MFSSPRTEMMCMVAGKAFCGWKEQSLVLLELFPQIKMRIA